MTVTVAEGMKQQMLNGLAEELQDCLIKEGDRHFFQFDEIVIQRGKIGYVDAVYYWRGHEIFTLHSTGIVVAPIRLTGMEGRMEFTLT